uniref:Hemolymph juvenile hormone binding protein n=1 Tax=Glossina morsitans morsitans TaxID=37546 RepID=A0A1B0FGW7_GLOMM
MCKQVWRSTIFLVLYGLSHIRACDLPPEIEKCKAGDHICVTQRINDVIRLYPEGNPLFKMPNLKLITVDRLAGTKTGSNTQLQLKFQLFDVKITGWDKATALSAKGFEKDTQYHEIELQVPIMKIVGRYEIDGKLLLLPIKGSGNEEFIFKDVHITVTHKFNLEKRDGKNYIKTVSFLTSIEPGSVTFKFENLFGGNKELTDATNKVLSDNSLDVWNAMSGQFNNALGQLYRKLLSPGTECLSYDDFFATEIVEEDNTNIRGIQRPIPQIILREWQQRWNDGTKAPEIQKCKAGDDTCIAERINEIIRLYPKGNPTFGLPDFSLVKLDKATASRKSSNSPVKLNFILSNLEARGIEKLKVFKTKGFVKDVKNTEIDFTVPLLRINALYELDGKLLLLPIKGKGNVEIIFKDAHYFENLFGGNKELTDATNKVLTDSWQDVWNELGRDVNQAFSDALHFNLIPVADAISYDDYFAD